MNEDFESIWASRFSEVFNAEGIAQPESKEKVSEVASMCELICRDFQKFVEEEKSNLNEIRIFGPFAEALKSIRLELLEHKDKLDNAFAIKRFAEFCDEEINLRRGLMLGVLPTFNILAYQESEASEDSFVLHTLNLDTIVVTQSFSESLSKMERLLEMRINDMQDRISMFNHPNIAPITDISAYYDSNKIDVDFKYRADIREADHPPPEVGC